MNHVVLYEPEIPGNTGNIIRTCMATGSTLHLIEPLGFSVDDKSLKRAGMDYVRSTDIHTYKNWEDFLAKNPNATSETMYFLTRYGHRAPAEFDYSDLSHDYFFVLGKESTGIKKEILIDHLEHCMRLPMKEDARSLNLSNCAAIMVYEALRQQNYPGLSHDEYLKGPDFLEQIRQELQEKIALEAENQN
ncbi:MAG: tRNA (cytidine(34)-2'-O)-methyltransferase [Erysipelotrichaceae bacterium]|nr:tRNA (cytidine(34)-2'-O)-methyltransferase [Erysipelotrichaceae bacterium]